MEIDWNGYRTSNDDGARLKHVTVAPSSERKRSKWRTRFDRRTATPAQVETILDNIYESEYPRHRRLPLAEFRNSSRAAARSRRPFHYRYGSERFRSTRTPYASERTHGFRNYRTPFASVRSFFLLIVNGNGVGEYAGAPWCLQGRKPVEPRERYVRTGVTTASSFISSRGIAYTVRT